jgi:hypothetical protein
MQSTKYWLNNPDNVRRLMVRSYPTEISDMLEKVASVYNDIAVGLERGAIKIKHSCLMPQSDHLSGCNTRLCEAFLRVATIQ